MKTIYLSLAVFFLTACASETVVAPTADPVKVKIFTVKSNNNFSISDDRLKKAIEKRDLTLFAVVNHGEGAMKVAAPIGHSKLYIFGNPKSGTPLMQAEKLLGLELPMKVLVYEEDEVVKFAYKDISALMSFYNATVDKSLLDKITRTLDIITYEAAN